jgi:hypothetical protein
MLRWIGWLALSLFALYLADARAQVTEQGVQTSFRVRYVADGAVYVEGGRNAGLAEGMKLVIKQAVTSTPSSSSEAVEEVAFLAEFKVVSVAETSAVCEIVSSKRPIVVGDVVALPPEEVELVVQKRALSSTRKYPAMISFTEGDPMDEDVREYVPRPPLPEVNQARGRFGFDYSGMHSGGAFPSTSSQVGFVMRADITRISGTHWNLSGYWRGRIESRASTQQQSIQDLINRTYHMSLTYVNPDSHWVAGFGRMYLPWASSLQTIDGGYFGRRISKTVTTGIFAGSTPDPTSWSYDPNRRIAGSFLNVDAGSWDNVKYGVTFGGGMSTLGWVIDRPFVFSETNVSYKRTFSLYHAMQFDSPRSPDPTVQKVGAGLGQSFLTLRFQPHPRLELDLNHNYFRDVPTYDAQLVGTGMLDKFLFQGVSGGARVQLPYNLTAYTNIGRSSNSTDPKASWNTMFGLTLGKIWKTGVRADVRYSKFDSAFANGSYRALTLSRNVGEALRFEVQAGNQVFVSSATNDTGSRFVNAHVDVMLGSRYFCEGGFTVQHGALQNYTQWYTSFGYRFDNRWSRRAREVANAAQK